MIETLAARGEDTWFRLGDRDLATHLVRTERLGRGERPTDVARALAASLGVPATILPMTDDEVRTEVRTPDGWLDFQEYFVHRRQAPEVLEVRFRGIEAACITPEAKAAIEAADVIAIAPSNPIVSTGPILALPGVREALAAASGRGTPIVAVSGIVGGRALRGPADRMLASLGHEPTALGVARIYAGSRTASSWTTWTANWPPQIEALGMRTRVTDTVMTDDAARARLAAEVLEFAVAA